MYMSIIQTFLYWNFPILIGSFYVKAIPKYINNMECLCLTTVMMISIETFVILQDLRILVTEMYKQIL